jgi:hypothetical protein
MTTILTRPPVRPDTGGHKRKMYWTIHSRPNDAFALRFSSEASTAILGFRKRRDAILVGSMIEAHIAELKSWPRVDMFEDDLWFPAPVSDELTRLTLRTWEYNDLKILCTRNMLNLIAVEEIKTKGAGLGYSFKGQAIRYEADIDFYQNRFEELFGLS